jgi:hypothetical protein
MISLHKCLLMMRGSLGLIIHRGSGSSGDGIRRDGHNHGEGQSITIDDDKRGED